MKTIAELESDILMITMQIAKEFPELTKYINEMPVKVIENELEVNNAKNLKAYYNSLVELMGEYARTHEGLKEIGKK